MKVKRLELKGFRGFDEIVLDFDTSPQKPTVFIGNNGVGKSSILDALNILLSWFTSNVKHNRYQFKKNSLTGEKKSDGKRASENDIKNYYDSLNQNILVEYKEKKYNWSISNLKKDNLQNLYQLTDNISNDIENKSLLSIPIIIHYPVNRSVIKIPLESKINYSTDILDVYDEILGNDSNRNSSPKSSSKIGTILNKSSVFSFDIFFEWFRTIEDLENENRVDNREYRDKQLVAVRKAIHVLIPAFDNLRVRRNPLRMTVNKKIGNKVEEFTINQLSDGEKCLLAMVGDIARRLAIANPSLDDPLQGEGIVLIDEIELHLHPTWQREIIPRLTQTFPNCQFIVTTHSPQVLSQVHSENIYILQSTENGIIASHPESSYGRDSNQILENLMDTPKRPKYFDDKILELFRLIDQNDLEAAKQLRQSLEEEIDEGSDDPEVLWAGGVINRKEVLGR
ncbi:MAG: AAA family ATPase [Snowella sp.]|nr:AAA family ATPase [Snowella sp.]